MDMVVNKSINYRATFDSTRHIDFYKHSSSGMLQSINKKALSNVEK